MGLDVYLYRYDITPEEHERRAAEVEAAGLALRLRKQAATETGMPLAGEYDYPDWENGRAQQPAYEARLKELCAEHQINEYGQPSGYGVREQIKRASALHPEHMYRIGYFRSSYNDGGINRILGKLCGKGLDDIFPGDDYVRRVDWSASLAAAREVRKQYLEFRAEQGDLATVRVDHNAFRGSEGLPRNEEQALKIFLEQRTSRSAFAHNYSNIHGDFFLNRSFEVLAAIPCVSSLGAPAVTLVGRWKSKDGDDESDWYAQALDVVVETCEWVLNQPHPERFYLHWSS